MNETHAEKAVRLFREGMNCAQSVFAAFSDVTGIDEELAVRLSSSFGAGMGRMREVCGACSAMFMVAGILYGPGTGAAENAAACVGGVSRGHGTPALGWSS